MKGESMACALCGAVDHRGRRQLPVSSIEAGGMHLLLLRCNRSDRRAQNSSISRIRDRGISIGILIHYKHYRVTSRKNRKKLSRIGAATYAFST